MIRLSISFFIFCSLHAGAQNYTPVDAGSAVKFTIKNFGLNVNGSFTGLQGKIIFDPANIAAASFVVSVHATTVNTGNGSRDNHLRKEEYFNVAGYPKLNFISTKVMPSGKAGSYTMEGNLTIKGVSKPVSFPFTASPKTGGYQFSGKFSINRRDFKVGSSSWVLSDELTVSLNISANKL
jgi:polyisoprenoid-binding protein YceI